MNRIKSCPNTIYSWYIDPDSLNFVSPCSKESIYRCLHCLKLPCCVVLSQILILSVLPVYRAMVKCKTTIWKKTFFAYELVICSTVLLCIRHISGWDCVQQDFNCTIWICNNACLWNAGSVWATTTYRNCLPARPHDIEHKYQRPLLLQQRGRLHYVDWVTALLTQSYFTYPNYVAMCIPAIDPCGKLEKCEHWIDCQSSTK